VYTSNGKMCDKTILFHWELEEGENVINLDSSFVLCLLAVKMLEFIYGSLVLIIICANVIGKHALL
jgi:hypothetical protein